MGSADRQYWRESETRQSGPRSWSVTTWLIALCVGVFAVDAFLPRTWQVVGTGWIGSADLVEQVRSGKFGLSSRPVGKSPSQFLSAEQVVDAVTPAGPVPVARLQLASTPPMRKWLCFSTATAIYTDTPGRGISGLEVWRIIGFQFCHADMNHLIFNMIGLFFFGPIVERYLGSRRYLAFYLICGVAGALVYLLLNASGFAVMQLSAGKVTVPGLLFNDPHTPLVGASAGIFGILMAAARIVPNATVLLFFIIPMRLATLAYGLVIIAVGTVVLGGSKAGSNAGGEAAHIGGAIAGWWLIAQPERLQGFFDLLGRANPSAALRARRASRRVEADAARRPSPADAEIDRILAKISAAGIGSLTEEERRILREASRR